MPDDKPYEPLSERLHQDVMHDNFVPKFSGLATAKPSALILIGVWLIFAPWFCFAAFTWILLFPNAGGAGEVLAELIFAAVNALLCCAVLFVQTRRFLLYREPQDDEVEAEGEPQDGQ